MSPQMIIAEKRRKNIAKLKKKKKAAKAKSKAKQRLDHLLKVNQKIAAMQERPFLTLATAYELCGILEEHLTCRIYPSGAIRRRLPRIIFASFVAVGEVSVEDVQLALAKEGIYAEKTAPKGIKARYRGADIMLIYRGVPIYIHKAMSHNYESALLYTTGNNFFFAILASKARKIGLVLRKKGLFLGETCIATTEADIFYQLGLKYVEPVERSHNKHKRIVSI